MTITELRARKAKVFDECRAFLDSHRNESGILNNEDDKVYQKMLDTVDSLENEIKRAEDLEARSAAMNAATSSPITSVSEDKAPQDKRASDDYRKAFMNHIRARRVYNTNGDLQEDTASEGGYLVPVEFENTLIKAVEKEDPIFAHAYKLTMGRSEKNVPVVTDQGLATLIAEEGSYGVDGDTFTQVVFHAYKFGRIAKASEELVQDSAFDIANYLAESLGSSIGKCEAGYFWTGSGSSQPQGVLTGAGSGITTATSSAITADEIIDLFFSLAEQYRGNAAFYFNDATVKAIRKLKDGNGQYLWTPGFNGTPSEILGKPVYTSANIPTISSSAKVGCFGDLSKYWIGTRSGVNFLRLNELYAANGQIGFRGSVRADGHVVDSAAIQKLTMHA